jgi:hypothetical protein
MPCHLNIETFYTLITFVACLKDLCKIVIFIYKNSVARFANVLLKLHALYNVMCCYKVTK